MPHLARCVSCLGPHAATDQACPRFHEQKELLERLKKQKARFFPEAQETNISKTVTSPATRASELSRSPKRAGPYIRANASGIHTITGDALQTTPPGPGPGPGPGSDNCSPTTPAPNIAVNTVQTNPANLTRPIGSRQTNKRRSTGGGQPGTQTPRPAPADALTQELYDIEFTHISQNDSEDSEYLPPRHSRVRLPSLTARKGDPAVTRKRGRPRSSSKNQISASNTENGGSQGQDKDITEPYSKRQRRAWNGRKNLAKEGVNAAGPRRKQGNKKSRKRTYTREPQPGTPSTPTNA